MAEPDGRFINFRSYGTSGHLAQLANGSFLTVWTEFDEQGGAYVYGMAFKADGTTLKDVFLIEYASSALFSDVTATTLSDGRTVVAWTKSAGATSVVAKVLNADLSSTGTLLEMSLGINSAGTPQVHALDVTDDQGQQYIGFAATYQGSYNISTTEDFTGTIVHAVVETAPDVWGSIDYQGLHRLPDSSSSTAVLGDRTYVLAVSMPDTKSLRFYRQGVGDADWSEFDVGQELTGTHPIVSSIGANKFVVAWERNDGSQIQAQVFGTDGKPEAGLFSFEKPTGTLIGAPVIKQLASGGFAVALRVDVGNGDDNVYTAAVDAQGNSIIALTAVGKITTGDQWDPSITILSGDKYAVSWQSDGEGSLPQYIVEVFGQEGADVLTPVIPGHVGEPPPPPPPPPPSNTWSGTEGNDVRIGSDASELFYGLGGNDKISGGDGNDGIDGGTGNDRIRGGLGNDILKGGEGFNEFVFDTKPNKSTNKDKILDFHWMFDEIWLDNKVFTKLGKKGSEKSPALLKKSYFASEKAKDKDDYIIYSKKKGVLSYDADGSGSKYKAVEFATVNPGTKIIWESFYVI